MAKNHISEKLIAQFKKNAEYQRARRAFSKYFGESLWFLVGSWETLPRHFENLRTSLCRQCKVSPASLKGCKAKLVEIIKRASKTNKTEKLNCQNGRYALCHPIVQGERVYGYIIICQIKKPVSKEIIDIFAAFVETIISDSQKELELKKLYDTIRPRAIALSTVHTLHRLISSTLNLNELLPRVARLSLQVMRANRCSIKLVDSKKKTLLPKSTVDLRTKDTKLKKVVIGKWAPGKAVKYGRTVKGRNYLATPLIDEDVIGVITIYDKIDKKPFTDFDAEIMRTLCEQAVIAIKNAQLYKEQERLTVGSIRSIAAILKTKAEGTYLPKASFLRLVQLIGQELRMSESELKCLQYASLLHDAGQITLPDEVIAKKGLLTGEEYDLIKEHPKKAAQILRPLRSLKDVVPIILHHHENYDGTGYPVGIKGNDIPLGARIMGLVGAFEAMITAKSYRKPLSIEEAIEEIKKNSGKQFDPKVIQGFLNVIRRKDILKMLKKEIYGPEKTDSQITTA